MTKPKVPFRAPNFTPKEVETLIYHLELKPELIRPAVRLNRDGGAAASGVLTITDKLRLWEEVATEINNVGESRLTGIIRSATDVKKKWNDLKSRVKNKAEDIRTGKISDKTPLSHLEERVLYLIAKTSHLKGANGALPPAYVNVLGRRKRERTASSSSEPMKNEDLDELNAIIESNTVEEEEDDDDNNIITVKQEPLLKVSEVVSEASSPPTMPAVNGIPIITFTAPFSQILRTSTTARTSNDFDAGSSSKRKIETDSNDYREADTQDVIEMIYSSQKELKNEMKSIKKIMIRMTEQKRKRIEQENEKIQLKKMKLMLQCQKQGIDYDEFITEFL